MKYDVKFFEGHEEFETVRDLTEIQTMALTQALKRCKIKHLVKEVLKDG